MGSMSSGLFQRSLPDGCLCEMRRLKINVRESLRASFKDGVFASLMTGVTDHYVIPFALLLGATVQQVGLVSAFPKLLSSVSQLYAVDAVQRIGGGLKLFKG